mmetsp:Transcript_31340/g.82964  ORF Transcript_31340/g.82964 Transcript_31340/m.82964 type:complete len:341 (+) Transcript_31340:571-1593(+)
MSLFPPLSALGLIQERRRSLRLTNPPTPKIPTDLRRPLGLGLTSLPLLVRASDVRSGRPALVPTVFERWASISGSAGWTDLPLPSVGSPSLIDMVAFAASTSARISFILLRAARTSAALFFVIRFGVFAPLPLMRDFRPPLGVGGVNGEDGECVPEPGVIGSLLSASRAAAVSTFRLCKLPGGLSGIGFSRPAPPPSSLPSGARSCSWRRSSKLLLPIEPAWDVNDPPAFDAKEPLVRYDSISHILDSRPLVGSLTEPMRESTEISLSRPPGTSGIRLLGSNSGARPLPAAAAPPLAPPLAPPPGLESMEAMWASRLAAVKPAGTLSPGCVRVSGLAVTG